MTAMERPPFLSQFFKRLITVFLRHRLSTFDSPLWARHAPNGSTPVLKKCKSTRPSELTDAPSLELKVEVGFEGELSPVKAADFDCCAHFLCKCEKFGLH